jgi:general secretion pathway protein G
MNADRGTTTTGNRGVLPGKYEPVVLFFLAGLALLLLIGWLHLPTHCRWEGKKEKVKAAQVQIEAHFATALDMYKERAGRYPTTEEGLLVLTTRLWPNAQGREQPIMLRIPPDPWGHEYQYVCPGVHNPDSYDLCSYGRDGQPGSGDDFTNWEPEDVPGHSNRVTRVSFFAIVAAGGVALAGIVLFALHRRAEKRIALDGEGGVDK